MALSSTERTRLIRHRRKTLGLCAACGRGPIVASGLCEFHAVLKRRRDRIYKHWRFGAVPRSLSTTGRAVHAEPTRYATASNAEGWEWCFGRPGRILVDWRDPLLVLMAREAQGWFQFLGRPSPVTTPRVSYA